MDMMLFTNIVLIVLCIFTMLLVWSRNWKLKQAYFEKIKSNSENLKWVGQNLTGQEWKDLKAVSDRFGLPMLQAKQLIDFYKNSQR
ncbi:TPA: hypothetical protein ACU8BH_000877 [Neisseria subflava]